jgi:hypothetical protein
MAQNQEPRLLAKRGERRAPEQGTEVRTKPGETQDYEITPIADASKNLTCPQFAQVKAISLKVFV